MTQIQAVFISTFIAATVAIWGVLSQRAIARRRATIDLIARNEADHDLIQGYQKYVELALAPEGLAKWADIANEKTVETQTIRLILNQYELVAIGIQLGILDYKFWQRWGKSTTIRSWNHASPFVLRLRERLSNPAVYHEFEELVKALQGEKMPKRNWWLGRFF
jgi:Domain of unknown function (DUF4760)